MRARSTWAVAILVSTALAASSLGCGASDPGDGTSEDGGSSSTNDASGHDSQDAAFGGDATTAVDGSSLGHGSDSGAADAADAAVNDSGETDSGAIDAEATGDSGGQDAGTSDGGGADSGAALTTCAVVDGGTWSFTGIAPIGIATPHDTMVAADGTVYVGYISSNYDDVGLAKLAPTATTWTYDDEFMEVTPNDVSGEAFALAPGDSVDVFYGERSFASDKDEADFLEDAPRTVTSVDTEPPARLFEDTVLAVDADGTVHLAYTRNPDSEMRYGSRALGGSLVMEPVGSSLLGYTQGIAVDSHGTVHLIFWDGDANTLREAQRASNGSWTTSTLTAGGYAAQIFIDSHDGTHVASYSNTTFALTYLYRAPGASTYASIVVDVAGGAPGLGVDIGGGVHIAYYEQTAYPYALRYAYLAPAAPSFATSVIWSTHDSPYLAPTLSLALDRHGGVHVDFTSIGDGELPVYLLDGYLNRRCE